MQIGREAPTLANEGAKEKRVWRGAAKLESAQF
jgi:hypothetical protein